MPFLTDLEQAIRDRPDWQTARSDDGQTIRVAEEGKLGTDGGPEIHVREEDGSILLDRAWKLPLQEGKAEELMTLVLEYLQEAFENHGWEVPIVLYGGPLHGKRMTKHRQDLAGRLMFARRARKAGDPNRAHLYKWRLKRSDDGEYVCAYERSLEGDEVDAFFARGVASTGPFVVTYDK